jgi:TPR repeat/Tetratricopeptide repeat
LVKTFVAGVCLFTRLFSPLPLLLLMGFSALATTAWLNPGDLAAITGPWRTYVVPKSIDPKAVALVKRGDVLAAEGDYDGAIAEYTEALSIEPTYEVVYENRANVYFAQGEYDLAIADYDVIIRFRPKYVEAFFRRAVAYYNRGNYARAIAGYNEVIRLNPRYAPAYAYRILAFQNKGSSTPPSPITLTQSFSIQSAQTPATTMPSRAMQRATSSEPLPTTMWRSGSFRSTPWSNPSSGSYRSPSWSGASAPSHPTTTARAAPAPVMARQSGFVRR